MEIISTVSKMGNVRVIRIPEKYLDELIKSGLYDADVRGHPVLKITINKV